MLTLLRFKLWLKEWGHLVASMLVYSVWEYWLGKSKQFAVNSTWEIFGWVLNRLFKKGKSNMEKDIAIGKVGEVKLSFAGGKAVVGVEAHASALDGAAMVVSSTSASMDAGALIDMLFKEIESKSPAGVQPIEEAVKSIVKNAVLALP